MTPVLVLFGVAIVISNLFALQDGFNFMKEEGGYVKADLGALSLARAQTPPSLRLTRRHRARSSDRRHSGQILRRNPRAWLAGRLYRGPNRKSTRSPARGRRQRAGPAYAIAPRTQPAVKTAGCARLPIGARTVRELQLPTGGAVVINRTNVPLVIGVGRSRSLRPSQLRRVSRWPINRALGDTERPCNRAVASRRDGPATDRRRARCLPTSAIS